MMTYSKDPILRAVHVSQVYNEGKTQALRDVNLDIMPGELTLLRGTSGSGKTSLLNIFAAIERPSEGTMYHRELRVSELSDSELSDWRRRNVGIAFQRAGLLQGLTAGENILAPHSIRDIDQDWAGEVCDKVGLNTTILGNRPHELSGGQRQRVALARAMIHKPEVVLLDEPTASLDSTATAEIHGFVQKAVQDLGMTALLVSHDASAARYADRVVDLKDGAISSDAYILHRPYTSV